MRRLFPRTRFVTWIAMLSTLFSTTALAATAGVGIVSTQTAIELDERKANIARAEQLFERADVQQILVAHGVDPAAAIDRVDALTDQELAELVEHIDTLPAGGTGILEVLGVVIVVLIVLEILGVTNVFTAI